MIARFWRLWLTAAGLPARLSKHPGLTFDLTFMTVQAAIEAKPNRENVLYLRTKRDRMGHTIRIHHQDARFGSDWGPLDEHEAPSLP